MAITLPADISSANELDANVVDRVTASSTLVTEKIRFVVSVLVPSLALKTRLYEVRVS